MRAIDYWAAELGKNGVVTSRRSRPLKIIRPRRSGSGSVLLMASGCRYDSTITLYAMLSANGSFLRVPRRGDWTSLGTFAGLPVPIYPALIRFDGHVAYAA